MPVTGQPPPGYTLGGYYEFDPIDWTPDERVLLAGLASEWASSIPGGARGPQMIAAVTLADRRRHVLAHGDVAFPSWTR